MGTTSLVVELIVIGTGAALWVVLIILIVFGYTWLPMDRLPELLGAPALIPILSIVYILGVVTDRFSDWVFSLCDHSIRRSVFADPNDYQLARTRLYTESEGLTGLLEYGRSRMRVCRGWVVNSLLILATLNLFICLRLPNDAPRLRLTLFSTVALILIAIGCWSTWHSLVQNEYDRLSEQSALLHDNSSKETAP